MNTARSSQLTSWKTDVGETEASNGHARSPGAALREGGHALLGISAIALVVRVIGLGTEFWTDEILALRYSFRLPLSTILTDFGGDNHHPLYSAFARVSLVLFGESTWSLRLPAVLFGVGAVVATYLVARLALSRREALVSSLLLAVSYHHVWFSQNARGYTLIGLLALMSTWALILLLEQPSWRLALAYAIFAALAAYTHLTMVFVAVGQALVALVEVLWPQGGRKRIGWTIPVGAFFLAAVFTVLLYAPMVGEVVDFFVNVPSDLVEESTPLWAAGEAIRVLLMAVGGPGAVVASVVLLTALAVGAAGFLGVMRANRNLALAIALPPLAVLAGALVGRGTMYPRFFFFVAGTAVIVFVHGLFECVGFVQRRLTVFSSPRVSVTLAGLVIVLSAASLILNYRYPKQDFAGAMHYVLDAKEPGDVVGFAGVTGDPYVTIYGRDWPTVTTAADVNALRARGRMWLIYTFPRYLESGAPEVAAIVERDCREQAVFRGTVGGGDVIICTLDQT